MQVALIGLPISKLETIFFYFRGIKLVQVKYEANLNWVTTLAGWLEDSKFAKLAS